METKTHKLPLRLPIGSGQTEESSRRGFWLFFAVVLLPALAVLLSGCIVAFKPIGGPTLGGTTVIINGNHLTGSTAVYFGSTPATSFTVTSTYKITALTNSHAAGSVEIRVITPEGINTSLGHFTFVTPPRLTSFTPTSGPTSGGTRLTLTGTNFTAAIGVTFGMTPAASYTVTGPTTITAVTNGHAAGTARIKVTTRGGTASASTDFRFVAPVPTITSFSSTSGTTSGGTTVTITGTNFTGTDVSTTAVTFGTTTAASYSVTSPTQITAVTKPHAAGTVAIKVTTQGGTATPGTDYTFVPPRPTVTSFAPASGTTSGGTSVTIAGTGLYGATAVKFGSTAVTSYTVTSPTQITASTKSHVPATVPVSVSTAGGTGTSSGDYTFVAPHPTITSFTPSSGTTNGGTSVTITGTGFVGATAVRFGTTPAASYTVTGPTQITATTAPHAAATYPITVLTAAGTATSSADYTFVAPRPTVTSLTPTTGTTSGGTTVTISGTGFEGATAVAFGTTTAASFAVTSPTSIRAVTKPQVAGTVRVKVTTAGGASSSTGNFKFVASTPRLTSFTPVTGPTSGTTTVTITGTDLYGATAVKFGTTTAKSYTVTSPTTVKAVTEAHAAGTVNVKVTTAGGTVTASAIYKFVAPVPAITSFSPTTGTTSGTATVTITGTGFTGASSLTFGTTTAKTFTVTSPTTVKAVTKPHVAATVTIKVTTAGGTATSPSAYRFVAPTPTITSFMPATGTTSGTTTVAITGTGLFGATSVKFGTTTAKSFTVTSPTTLKATTRPHVAATVKVRVTTAGGTGTSTGNYKFVAPTPTITGLTPTSGTTAGGTTVEIGGSNFTGASSVKFGTTPATTVRVIDPTKIRVKDPAHAAGTVSVKVTTAGGTATAPSDYKFVVPVPTITSFTPATGTTSGTTTVTITGTGLNSTTAVKFGTTTAKSFTVTSLTQIKAVTKPHVAGTVTVKATTAGGTATALSDFKFTAPVPTITSFAPATGTTSGTTTVTVTGTGLNSTTAVKFGTTTAKRFTVTSPTQIKAVTKPHVQGTVAVKATTSGGTITASSKYRFVAPFPIASSLTPASGTTSGTTTVTITGTGLYGTTALDFGTSPVKSYTVTSPTQIKVVTEPHAAGTVAVTLWTAGGEGSHGYYKYVAPVPTISSFTPATGTTLGTTSVTITGTGLYGATSVDFGSTPASHFHVTSPTSVTAFTRPHVAGTVTIKVITAGGTAKSSSHYKFGSTTATLSFTPTTGTTSGTTTVTITGTGLSTATSVRFGTTTAKSFAVTSPTRIEAVTNPHVAGTVTVKVITTGGTDTALSDYKFVAPVPTITSFTPATGLTTGTSTVSITGTGLYGATAVKFGATTAKSFVVTSPTRITAITMGHVAGAVAVKATTAGGTGVASSDYQFVVPAPTITSIAPATGATTGGTTVTITGTNFQGTGISVSSVKFGTTTASNFTVVSATTIRAVTKAHAAGTVTVNVTTVGGTATAPSDYKFGVLLTTTTTVTSSSDPSQRTRSVTYTASVSPAAPSGSVVFTTGTTAITCTSSTAYSSGVATCKVKYIATSTGKSIKAVFTSSSGRYENSTSAVLTQEIEAAPTATNVSLTQTESTTTAVSTTFTSTNGASYIIFAGHTSSQGDNAAVSATNLKTLHKITAATNSITVAGALSGSEHSWQWAWYGTGNNSSGAITVTFTDPTTKTTANPYNLLQVVKVTGVDPYNPVVGATLTKAKTASERGTVTLSSSSTADQLVNLYLGGDMGGAAPPWTSTVTNVTGAFQHSGGPTTGDGEDTALGPPGTGSTTAGSTGPGSWPATNTTAFGAVDLQLRLPVGAPTISSFTPATGLPGGTTTVTITGSNFSGPGITVTSVKFGTTTATSYTVTSPTQIKAITKPHSSGTVTISVATSGGVATSNSKYRFVTPSPTISSFTPATGTSSGTTTVTITGTGLLGATAVKFGTTAAKSFAVTSSTQITAITKPHAQGNVTVRVTTAGGTGTAPTNYWFAAPVPTITSFTPATGTTSGTTTVTITGTGLYAGIPEFGVTNPKSYTVTSPTQIKAVTAPHVAGTVAVKVITGGGTATALTDFKYVAPTPVLSSFTPPMGATRGTTTVTISGTGLYGATAVKFGTTTAKRYTVTSPTQITAVTKAHVRGTVSVKVATAGGSSTAESAYKFVTTTPTTIIFTPASGTTSGTTTVTITGPGLSSATAVTFGTTTAKSFTVTSTTQIKAITKPHVYGTVPVKVTVSGGTATAFTDFRFQAPVPTIRSFTPTAGTTSGTTSVTIIGTGLYGASSVNFGNTAAKSYTVTSPTQITAVTKPHVAGTVTVGVSVPGGGNANRASYEFSAPAPSISSFTPTTGTASGTTTVTITGTGLYGATAVKFGTTTAKSFTVTSPTQIKAITKPHSADTVIIKVTTAGGTATASSDYKFVLPPPTITSFTPATGTTAGTTTVTITGSGFSGIGFSTLAVTFGTTTAKSFTVTSGTQIKAVTKPHVAGTVAVSVTTTVGTATSSTNYKFPGTAAQSTANWNKLNPASSPANRSGAAAAFDPATGQTIVFGGADVSGYLGDTWTWNGTSWTALSPSLSPAQRAGASISYDPSTGQLILFGGLGTGGSLDDTWAWTGSTWARITPPASPPPRSGAAMAYDPARGQLILFGGEGESGMLDDTWAWNGVTWTKVTVPLSPAARAYAAMQYDTSTSQLVLFGGIGASGKLDDTWTWNGTAWSKQTPTTSPSARSGAATAFDQSLGRLELFGGTGSSSLSDNWTWNGANWAKVTPATTPSARGGAAMAFDSATGQIVLFGGSETGAYVADTWEYGAPTYATDSWYEKYPSTVPPKRQGGVMDYDPATGSMLLFGGNYKRDTWTWNGSTWTELFPKTSPSGSGFSMVYDPAMGEMVLFGGYYVGDHNTTWTWNGSNWTELSPDTNPPARANAAMAYDPATGDVVLFGGTNTSPSSLDDTWTWNGVNWTEQFPTKSPPGRSEASMTYDPAMGKILLFGGTSHTGHYQTDNDTWTWNGTNWAQLHPATSPPARTSASMAYDPATGSVLLFGGRAYALDGPQDDTWAWNGVTWIEQAPTKSPGARTNAPMAYDPATGNMVLFGGANNTPGTLNDTWIYTASIPAPTVTKLTPSSGPTSGFTEVVVHGTNLTGASVTIGGKPAPVVSTGSTAITATVPPSTPGSVTVTVSAYGGTTTQAAAYTYVAAPSISKITPPSGPTTGSTTVTITGSGFTATSVVQFGATVAASYTITSSTTIKAVTKPHAAASVAVKVATVGGTATAPSNYTFTGQ